MQGQIFISYLLSDLLQIKIIYILYVKYLVRRA